MALILLAKLLLQSKGTGKWTLCQIGPQYIFNKSSAVDEMGNRGHNRHGPEIEWRLCPFSGGAGSPSNAKSPGPRPTSTPSGILNHPAVWPQQTLAENCGLCSFRGEKLGPHLTQCLRLRPTSVPGGILIHTAVWPQ